MFGGISIWYGIKGIIAQHEPGSSFIVAHLTIISLGVFLTLIGVLIIRETKKTNDS